MRFVAEGPANVQTVQQHLARNWRTRPTMLNILTGGQGSAKDRAYLYKLVSRSQHMSDIVDRLFGGSAESLASLVEMKHLSPTRAVAETARGNRRRSNEDRHSNPPDVRTQCVMARTLIVGLTLVIGCCAGSRLAIVIWVVTLLTCHSSIESPPLATSSTAPKIEVRHGSDPGRHEQVITPGEDVRTRLAPKKGKFTHAFLLAIGSRAYVGRSRVSWSVCTNCALAAGGLPRAWRRTDQIVAGAFECLPGGCMIESINVKPRSASNRVACFAERHCGSTGVFDRIVTHSVRA
jgi:hypothetical protein